jgi:hypothetical protein
MYTRQQNPEKHKHLSLKWDLNLICNPKIQAVKTHALDLTITLISEDGVGRNKL